MQITIHIEEQFLSELANFISASIKYEHTINYSKYVSQRNHLVGDYIEVNLFYDDFVSLEEWQMKTPD